MADLIRAEDISSTALDAFRLVAQNLRDGAKERRRKRTPKAIRKPLVVGKDADGNERKVEIVDRPEYQRFLDENFPGWSVTDQRFWIDSISTKEGVTLPILFNCSLTLVVYELNIRRTVPGIGSAPVSRSEVTRDTSTLLRQKYAIAYTNAMKTACGWLGAFFDLRVDDQEREDIAAPPSDEQQTRFTALIERVPTAARDAVRERWATQNRASANKFLDQMIQKLNEREAANGGRTEN